MDQTLRNGARRALDDDPGARAAHLAARLRAGELSREQLELAARLGDPAAALVAALPDSSWTAAVSRWGPDPLARAAVAAARTCLPALERPQRQVRLLREAERLLGAPVERRQAARTLRDGRYAPVAPDSDEVVSLRWAAQEAVQGARVLSLWAESAAPLRLAVVAGHAAHARARAGLDPDGVLEQVRRELLPWLLDRRREPPPRPVGSPPPIFGWTDDEDTLLPMLLVGWDDHAGAEPPPAPLLHFWQQAGGYCFSRHPSYVGCPLPLAANLDRLGPAGGHLLCALDALGEDPRWEVLRARFPSLQRLTWTNGAPYDADRLTTLEAFLARHVALPALEPGGVEAALRLVPCDPLAWFAGWTTAEAGPAGLGEGPPFDAATYEAVVAWGRENCPGKPPRVHLAWRNCD